MAVVLRAVVLRKHYHVFLDRQFLQNAYIVDYLFAVRRTKCRANDLNCRHCVVCSSRQQGDAGTIYDFPLPPIHIQITPIILSQQHTTLAAHAAGITSLTNTLLFNAFAPCPDKAANGKA